LDLHAIFHYDPIDLTCSCFIELKTEGMSEFAGRVYVVTGGASGMGLEVTKKLLAGDAYVFVADLGEKVPAELANLKRDRLTYIQCDVGTREACQSFMEKVVSKHGRIDGLICSAGILPAEGELASDEIFHKVFNVNVNGVFYFCTAALPIMKEQKYGRIVIFGSGASFRGVSNMAVYCGTKHAVLGFTRAWAKDWAKYGINVNAVGPGVVWTPLVQRLNKVNDSGVNPIDQLKATIPQGRVAQPDEIADSVLFLLGDKAGYINGQILPINGGSS